MYTFYYKSNGELESTQGALVSEYVKSLLQDGQQLISAADSNDKFKRLTGILFNYFYIYILSFSFS